MKIQILHSVPLKDLSTFHIGGKARFFTSVKTKDELKEAFLFAKSENLPYFILGKGSNILIDDRGFQGLVIHNKIDFCEFTNNEINVGSGFSFSRLGIESVAKGLTGLEFASTIPGSVGGAIFMNASAFGDSLAKTISKVLYMTKDGEEKVFLANELNFGYRCSSFNNLLGCIVSAEFKLEFFKDAKKKLLELVEKRKKSQPSGFSIGCIFRNGTGYFAGELIEKCGLKGKKIGEAFVSEVHANFIMNEENAKSEDVLSLIACVKKEVKEKFAVELKEEIKYLPPDLNGIPS